METPNVGGPRVLLLDIENSPYQVFTWDNNPRVPISHQNIVKNAEMLSAAWKWLGEDKVYSKMVRVGGDDKELTKELQWVIAQADAVVAHFGNGHDIPWIAGRCLYHGLGPLKPVIQIDTWQIAKRKFKLFNNKLAYLAEHLGLPQKLDTDFDLWKKVMNGNREARAYMLKYNRQDVLTLEEVFKRIIPFVPAQLNHALFAEDDVTASRTCPTCGKDKLKRVGYGYTRANIKINLKCMECGAYSYRHPNTRPR